MSQGTEHWSPLQESCVSVGYDANEGHPMQIWAQDLTAVSPGQHPTSPLDMLFHPYPPYPQYLSGELPCMIKEQEGMDLLDDYLLPPGLADTESAGIIPDFSFDENVRAQPGGDLHPLYIPDDGVADSSTYSASTITESPQSAGQEYSSGLGSGDIKSLDTTDQILLPFDEDEYPQPGNVSIPASVLAFLPMSKNVNNPSNQTFVEPSASGKPTIKLEDIENDLKDVGSAQIQQAANKRRVKPSIHKCPVRKCRATFTARHNLRYHMNAHLGLKPYLCGTCTYAASSPATTKRHQKTCKGINPGHPTEVNA